MKGMKTLEWSTWQALDISFGSVRHGRLGRIGLIGNSQFSPKGDNDGS